MPIKQSQEPPEDGLRAVFRALRDLSNSGKGADLLGGAEVRLSQPLPLYRLEFTDLVNEKSNDLTAIQAGWRYLLERPEDGRMAFVDIRLIGGESRFVNFSVNKNADNLFQATHLAEHIGSFSSYEADVRILDIPSLKSTVLWLGTVRPTVISIIDGSNIFGSLMKVISEYEFIDLIVHEALALKSFTRDQKLEVVKSG